MILGYIRVSKKKQNFALQAKALKPFKCDQIFTEKRSGAKYGKEWEALYNQLQDNDTIVVWKIDRLGRVAWELIKLMTELSKRNIRFVSVVDGIDTATTLGKMWFSVSSVMAENERNVLIERTTAGLQAARELGRVGGRRKGLTPDNEEKMKKVKTLHAAGVSIRKIGKTLDIGSFSTIYKYINYSTL